MKRKPTISSGRALAVTAIIILAAAEANAGDRTDPAITLRITDLTELSAATLGKAQQYTSNVMAKSGISIVWLSCQAATVDMSHPGPCQIDLRPGEFWILIESRRPPKGTSDVLAYTVFDQSGKPGQTAGVYMPAVADLATHDVDLFAVLGAAISHELGHLLLGEGHTRQGIMSPHWGREQLERIGILDLLFTPEQSKRMRAEVAGASSKEPAHR